ncbi:deoxyribonuclease IV [Candidatus Chromulinivorax destructor]|uniref:Xylose isomerase-like TIM barrel domain-containing protein n=1 Tax=Candidatus Chromulinivorax destructor TaxID=2066483 RepID=A0A345ZAW2_9BACT|nr:deoxyribonuclease IV [Candidatus Chromulinivorax destructor]AXK60429.1 hypothetical protein C0J27_01550 [Candidatus Chromulinivorax destructor]
MSNRFGLHIRLTESIFDAAERAERLQIKTFQAVLMLENREFLNLSDEDIERFVQLRREKFEHLFVHGAYWSNITNVTGKGFHCLLKEIELAEKLEFTHIVIHPGSFGTDMTRNHRVNYIAKSIDILLQATKKIIIVLENSPHKDKSFSSNIEEFGDLCKKISPSDRVKICIDTAHAFVAGYDISTPEKVNVFVKLLATTIGIENIGLLHCNDTKKNCGSYLDVHAVPGHGKIGMAALYTFVHHPLLNKIPVVFEMPALDESLEYDIIQQFIDMEVLEL